ncbi:hypothetical protein ACFRAI_43140 [Streptomyces sp. NPDC056637]|uniref:hypothetical protein n=1 Tax=unclassified Streptomyces TaxID=2593676 RepID=UPI0036BB47C0
MPLVLPTATRRPVGHFLEARAFGHAEGSSHGTSRIFRSIYPVPVYIDMTGRAQEIWRELESDSGASLLRLTGGIHHGRGPQYLADLLKDQEVSHQLLSAADAAPGGRA